MIARTTQEGMGVNGEGIRNIFPEELTNEMSFEGMMGNMQILATAIDIYIDIENVLEKKLRADTF